MPVKLPSTKWELMALEKHTHLPLESVFHRSMESLHICSFSDYLWHNQYKNEIFLFLKYLLNLDPLPQSCLAKRHLHNKRKLSSWQHPALRVWTGHPAPGNVTWSTVPATRDMWKPHGIYLQCFWPWPFHKKGTASDAAWKEFVQLHSLNRLSPYLSLSSLATAKHMPLQPQRQAIVILSLLSFLTGLSCHAQCGVPPVCWPWGQSCSDHITATQHGAPHSGQKKPSEARRCTDLFHHWLQSCIFLKSPHPCIWINTKEH